LQCRCLVAFCLDFGFGKVYPLLSIVQVNPAPFQYFCVIALVMYVVDFLRLLKQKIAGPTAVNAHVRAPVFNAPARNVNSQHQMTVASAMIQQTHHARTGIVPWTGIANITMPAAMQISD
jgi:hypothetical protein